MPIQNRQFDSSDLSSASQPKLHEAIIRRGRRIPMLVALVVIFICAFALSVIWFVNQSMQQLTRQRLDSTLVANTTLLEMWLSEVRREAARQLESDSVAQAARNLLQQHADNSLWSVNALESNVDYQSLGSVNYGSRLGWALLDLDGKVVASNNLKIVGSLLPIPTDALQQVAARETTVSRPFKMPIAINGLSNHHSIPGGPLMCAMAPVTDDARTVGMFSLLIDPLGRFTDLLLVARTGQTGETYVFDRRGLLLSQSRFEPHLRSAGLLDSDPNIASLLNIELRDPGVDLTLGGVPSLQRPKGPLTLMADQATRGATGNDVIGYRSYQGVPVVGSWRWLPEYGIGIATEMEVAEAYRPVILLRRSIYGLLGLILVSGIGFLLIALTFRAANQRFRDSTGQPRKLGKYLVGDLIGQGGMGTVYRGRHQFLHRDVAIKVLEGDFELNRLTISRFEREVQLTAQLRHPNTIHIYDYGRTADGTFFYVMEYIEGINLQDLVQQYGRQSPARVIHLLLQVCGSLSEAHQLGMIHRDVKPSNLLLTNRSGLYDIIKVLDFGLVKQVDRQTHVAVYDSQLTQDDSITGTPMYMSPESVRDAAMANERSDLYSVGAVGYILLTGQPLFDGESSVDVCMQQLNEEPQRPSDRIDQALPEDLQNVLMSCLRKSPEERPMSSDDLADSLRHCQDANRWTAVEAIQWWEVGAN